MPESAGARTGGADVKEFRHNGQLLYQLKYAGEVLWPRPDLTLPYFTADITLDGTIADKVNYVNADVLMTADGVPVFNGIAQMRGRGNSTWGMPKKPYKFKLPKPGQSLYGFPASRDWALLANYLDRSMMRNAIAFEIFRRATGRWAPHSVFVRLLLNGDVQGLYQFIETCDVQPGRVDIREMDEDDTAGLALTGPYLLENDSYDPGFRTSRNTPFAYDVPDVEGVPEQETYIQDWIENFETVLVAGGDDFLEYIDLDSWVDWYIMEEFSQNNDSEWVTSNKFYKEQDTENAPGRLVMGPIWDFDRSFGYATLHGTPANNAGWYTKDPDNPNLAWPNWLHYMTQSDMFNQAVRDRYESAFRPVLETIGDYIDELETGLAPVLAEDRALWGDDTNKGRGSYIKTWIANRINFFDTNLPDPSAEEPDPEEPELPAVLAAYSFDGLVEELNGQAITDNSGNGRALTTDTSLQRVADGQFGQSIRLKDDAYGHSNSAAHRIGANSMGISTALPLTLSCWVTRENSSDNDGYSEPLLGFWEGILDSTRFVMYAHRTDVGTPEVIKGQFRTANGLKNIESNVALVADMPTHLVLSYDAVDTARLYINGELAQEVVLPWGDDSGPLAMDVNNPSHAFSVLSCDGWGRPFGIRVDNVRVYQALLTDEQVALDMMTAI